MKCLSCEASVYDRDYRKLTLSQMMIISTFASLLGVVLSKPFIKFLMAVLLGQTGIVTIEFIPTFVSIIVVNIVSLCSVYITINKVVKINIITILKKGYDQLEKKGNSDILFGLLMFLCATLCYFVMPNILNKGSYFGAIIFMLMGIIVMQRYVIEVYSQFIKNSGQSKWCIGLFAKQIPFIVEVMYRARQ